MKVIVTVAGFYGGTWYKENRETAQDMPEAVARQFLPPRGDQLALPVAPAAKAKPAEAGRKAR